MPQPKKLPERRQRAGNMIVLRGDGVAVAPAAPKGLLQVTRTAWETFWASKIAGTVELDSDLQSLTRLFTLYDERERSYRAYRKDRLVKGSQGQMVLNPLGRQLQTFDSEIRNLEDRFGLSPLARFKLGVQFGEAHNSLEELNRALDYDPDEEPDPRLEPYEGEASLSVDRD